MPSLYMTSFYLMILQYVFKNINPLILFYFHFSYLKFCIIINQNRSSYLSFQGWNLTRLFEWNIKVAYELKINHLDSLWSFFFLNLWFFNVFLLTFDFIWTFILNCSSLPNKRSLLFIFKGWRSTRLFIEWIIKMRIIKMNSK
jgi:hypothetical protein